MQAHVRSRENLRLPCIHKKEPDAFHSANAFRSANALLSRNQEEGLDWCEFQIMSWLIEGSGGESQC
jgi:hypothetical protein